VCTVYECVCGVCERECVCVGVCEIKAIWE